MKNIGKLYAYDFFPMLTKLYWLPFKKTFKALASLESCQLSRDLFLSGVDEKVQFSRFLEHILEFSIFFHEIYMVERSYQVLALDIKSLLLSAPVSLETRLKVPILDIF